MNLNEKRIEIICLCVFLLCLLFFLHPFTEDKQISHDSPYKFVAGDLFWLGGYSEGIKETGNAGIMAPYLVEGEQDVAFFRPPLSALTWASVSIFSDIEVYDIEFNSNLLFAVLFMLFLYVILREKSVPLALFSLPLCFLLFTFPFSYFITWGMQMSNFNFLFVLIAFLCLYYMREKFFVPVFSVLLIGGLYSHVRETIMLFTALAFYLLLLFIKKKDYIMPIKKILASTVVASVFFVPYLFIIMKTPNATKVSSLVRLTTQFSTSSAVYLSDMSWWIVLVGIGVLLFFLLLFTSKVSKGTIIAYSFSLGFLFSSYVSVLGNKATQIRHFFPLYLAPFMGLAINQAYVLLKSKKKHYFLLGFVVVACGILVFFFLPTAIPDYAVSNPSTYDSFRYIWANTPEEASFLILQGDNFYQETLFYFLKRKGHLLHQQELNALLKNESFYLEEIPISTISFPHYVKRQGVFSFEGGVIDRERKVAVCDYNYVYFNILSRNSDVQYLNRALVNHLVSNLNFSIVHQNDLAVTLKNEGCL